MEEGAVPVSSALGKDSEDGPASSRSSNDSFLPRLHHHRLPLSVRSVRRNNYCYDPRLLPNNVDTEKVVRSHCVR